jgi:phosphotransferase system HPr (HPr) family protein
MKEYVTVGKNIQKKENPVAKLVQIACRYESKVYLEDDARKINAKSIMGMMAFKLNSGKELAIVAEGSDEEEAVKEMEQYLAV